MSPGLTRPTRPSSFPTLAASSTPDRAANPIPAFFSAFTPFGSAFDYFADACQRTILFWDVMRKRGNQAVEHAEAGKPPVLSFHNEVVMDGRTLARPCNYMLLRIIWHRPFTPMLFCFPEPQASRPIPTTHGSGSRATCTIAV